MNEVDISQMSIQKSASNIFSVNKWADLFNIKKSVQEINENLSVYVCILIQSVKLHTRFCLVIVIMWNDIKITTSLKCKFKYVFCLAFDLNAPKIIAKKVSFLKTVAMGYFQSSKYKSLLTVKIARQKYTGFWQNAKNVSVYVIRWWN